MSGALNSEDKDPITVIRLLYPQLSETEKRISDYIISSPERIPFQSIYEIARACGTSGATVSRLVQKLGFPTVSAFKMALVRHTAVQEDAFYRGTGRDDSAEETVRKVFHGNIQSLEDTLELQASKELIGAAEKIGSAGRVMFYGIGSSGYLALDAAMRFSQLGIQAAAFVDPTEIVFHACTARPEDVAVALSHSGRTAITVKGIALVKERGGTTIGITNYIHTPLAGKCDYLLCTSFPETQVKITAIRSRIAQMCLIDTLFLLAARDTKPEIDYDRVNRITESVLRYNFDEKEMNGE